MNRLKFLTLLVVGLIISNGILFYMLVQKHHHNDNPKRRIIEKLHFDNAQISAYEVLIEKHRNAINENENLMREMRSKLYVNLQHEANQNLVDSFISKISTQQSVADKVNYNHFLEIKQLCKPNQQKDFNELTNEIAHLFSSKERK